jgi:hypothetical protein
VKSYGTPADINHITGAKDSVDGRKGGLTVGGVQNRSDVDFCEPVDLEQKLCDFGDFGCVSRIVEPLGGGFDPLRIKAAESIDDISLRYLFGHSI